MPNRLATEPSLYLRQHASNPVDWWPWGEDAWARARAENKPVLLSIGYSSCHWCHVMAHECFEDAWIAGLMNEHFINIKIDREERPDVDQIYMEAVQMITHHGGWPLHAFCFPDGRPFFGGTYFPPRDRGNGLIPWPQLLLRVSDFFHRNREQLEENADAIHKNLAWSNEAAVEDAAGAPWDPAVLLQAAADLCALHDDEWGGFGGAPKFPPAMTLDFLLAVRATHACEEAVPELAARIDAVIPRTLAAMARGGLFDQIGGGFFRYSVDRFWRVPHFEKMLYDNALLLGAYTRGWRRYRDPLFLRVIAETVDWLDREMSLPGQTFAAALDADSPQGEGAFYTWTEDEVRAALAGHPDLTETALRAWNLAAPGELEDGRSHARWETGDLAGRDALAPARDALYAARARRPAPLRDDKQLASWSALAIAALAEAAFSLDRPAWWQRAAEAAEWLWANLRDPVGGDGALHAVYYPGSGPRATGNLPDYTYTLEACLALAATAAWAQPGSSAAGLWLDRAETLAEAVVARFTEPVQVGCFFTPRGGEALIVRKKDWFDQAVPAGNSSFLHSLAALHVVTGKPAYGDLLAAWRPAYTLYAARHPAGVACALSALTQEAMGLAVVHFTPEAPLEALRAALAARPWRRVFLLPAAPDVPWRGFQVCVGPVCQSPTLDPAEAAALL